MAIIKAFKGYRPAKNLVEKVASLPYDVMNSKEARERSEGNPYTFLHVIKPEIDLPEDVYAYDELVYQKGKSNLEKFIAEGVLVQDEAEHFYVYRQIMDGRSQYGLVVTCAVSDYWDDVIKKHEYTRPKKEADRIKHMKTLSAHVGPVFSTYRAVEEIDTIVARVAGGEPEVDFSANDGIQHTLWLVKNSADLESLTSLFASKVPNIYIADGHHRAASSAITGRDRAAENSDHNGSEAYNFFLSVLFPDNQLQIIDYNRLITDLNGLNKDELFEAMSGNWTISAGQKEQVKPSKAFDFGMYIEQQWYLVQAKDNIKGTDPVSVLDISVLSNHLIAPILGIEDQRTSDRIDFVGGIRGLNELERRVDSGEMKLAFSIYPVSIKQLMDIADLPNTVMPPKTTWFEPKLRSGMVIHKF